MLRYLYNLNNNPIYIKEMTVQERLNSRRRFRVPACTGNLAIILLPITIAIVLSMSHQPLSIDELETVFMISVFLQALYYIYRGASHAWGLISGEKEMKTYGDLISTIMSSDEIVLGKFWTAFAPPAKELTLLFPVLAAIGLLLRIHLYFLLQVYLLTLLFMAFFSMVGIYFSAREKTSITARKNTVGTIAFLLVGTLIMIPVFTVFLDGSFVTVDSLFDWPVPQVMLLHTINPFTILWSMKMMIESPEPENMVLLLYIVYSLITMFIYTLLSWILYRETAKRMGEIPL